MSARLRLGVIGLGHFGRRHARLCMGLAGVELVAAADPDPRATVSGLRRVASCDELLGLGIDAAIVATPPSQNVAIATALASAGVHALFEKPLATSVGAARQIEATFRTAGLVAGVGHVERFNPAARALAASLPQIAPLHEFIALRRGPPPARSWELSVGLDLALHDLDLLAWMGSGIAQLRPTHTSRDKVHAEGALREGTRLSLVADRSAAKRERRLEAIGARGHLIADLVARELSLTPAHDPVPRVIYRAEPEFDALRCELEGFCAAVLDQDRAELVTLEAGVEAVRFAAQLSAQ
ncbi:NAD-dependent dehydrogenase [Enhygromyxa salina]|uniref:NAD-dependent dehydrogenase n=1 Tax=Enhygromyxa salina TaxID=215803 RepID=A0A0C2A5P5_9BACT|nr:Gfo/Idh/MocA family oxidoreductase [Enhygromyxa salina]KIG18703.1 NAD-dependent dehydrogenase [Enhygromyxa salina]